MATIPSKLITGQQVIKKSPIAGTGRLTTSDGTTTLRNTKQSGILTDNLPKTTYDIFIIILIIYIY